MRILVVGGAGFIGTNLCLTLHGLGHHVTVLDRAIKNYASLSMCEFHMGDMNDTTLLNNILSEKFDCVVNLAAVKGFDRTPSYTNTNIMGVISLMESCMRNRPRKIIHISSASVYGDSKTVPTKEDDDKFPVDFYGITKLAGEHACSLYSLPITIIRPCNVYGPHETMTMMSRIFHAMKCGNEITIHGDGSQRRTLTYVDDVVRGIIQAMECEECGIFNIGGEEELSVNEIVSIASSLVPLKIRFDSGVKDRISRRGLDTKRARETLGWMPVYGIRDGISATLRWLEKKSDNELLV